jgi:large subunit ribosomal protein L3
MNFILGKKVKMTQIFLDDGRFVPVTEISVTPSTVLSLKTKEKNGYSAVVLAYDTKNKIGKSIMGFFKDFGKFRHIKEFRIDDENIDLKPGDKIGLNSFSVGDKIKISSVSKGKGFQGVVKRHGFHGAIATHGTKDQLRMPGSIGATASARVFKGVRMAGRMGSDQVTTDNIEIVKIDLVNNLLYIKGAVSGGRNALVRIFGKGDVKKHEEIKKEEIKQEDKTIDISAKIEVAKDDTPDVLDVTAKEELVVEDVLPEVIEKVTTDKKEEVIEETKEDATEEIKKEN